MDTGFGDCSMRRHVSTSMTARRLSCAPLLTPWNSPTEASLLPSAPSPIGRAGCRSSLQGPISSRAGCGQHGGLCGSRFPGRWDAACPEQREGSTHGCRTETTLCSLPAPSAAPRALRLVGILFPCHTAVPTEWQRDPALLAAFLHRSRPSRSAPRSARLPAALAVEEVLKAKAPSLRYRDDGSAG